jgi:hypothetical protein
MIVDMKNIVSLSVLLFYMLFVSSCGNSKVERLKREIVAADASCPISSGVMGDIVSMKYDEKKNVVVWNYAIHQDYAEPFMLEENHMYIKDNLRIGFQNKDSKLIVSMIYDAGASLKYIFKSNLTGKTIDLKMSNKELGDILKAPDMTPKERAQILMNNGLIIQNATCPIKSDEGIFMEKLEIVNENFVYYFSVDEDMYSLDYLKEQKEVLLEGMVDYIKLMKDDPLMKSDIDNLLILGLGLQYRYYGKTSKEFIDVYISKEELKKIIG